MNNLADRAPTYGEELATALMLEVGTPATGKDTLIVQMTWTYDRFGATAVTGIGRYFIEDMGTSNPDRRYCLQHDETLGNFASMEEAQAYGQKDFERRVRACLV